MTTHLMAVKTRGNHTPENYRPTEDEPFMSNRQRAYFRSKLPSCYRPAGTKPSTTETVS